MDMLESNSSCPVANQCSPGIVWFSLIKPQIIFDSEHTASDLVGNGKRINNEVNFLLMCTGYES